METSHFKYNFFEWTKLLENNWKDIQSELFDVYFGHSDINKNDWFLAHPHYVKSNSEKAWKTFEFVFFGIKNLDNCKRCPKTFELLKKIPELVTAQFSVLEPNTKIDAHKGYTRMVLRNHLALKVPSKELCKLKIENEEHSWEEGKVITFDDSKVHEAWNFSNEPRMVLMFDVANPEMPYTSYQICKYKLENMEDPFLLNIAEKEVWLKWLEAGHFS
ncbi:MAG: aspartyl/asparaginyl beta-hydroxylase domain-containing protein [Flavobacteriales bacterium]